MTPDQCGTFLPKDHPDREAIEEFREFLVDAHHVDQGGLSRDEFLARWRAYMQGTDDEEAH